MTDWPSRVDGLAEHALPLDDRGLAYGDGLFETILLYRGRPVLWDAHLDRLKRGADALGIAAPTSPDWQQDLAGLLLQCPAPLPERLVLKLVLTRGGGGRGYAVDPASAPRRISRLLPAPPADAALRESGIRLRWCGLRLSRQPRLAGLKHLNRLEQVLARAECSDPDIDEGLLCDSSGTVVSAIAGNLFVGRGGRLLTPPINAAGVAGTCRGALLAAGVAVEQALGIADIESADELFLCNSVRGILPVGRLGDRCWPVGPLTRAALACLAAIDPAFE